MLMALYNITISVNGLKLISESPGLLPLLCTLLEGLYVYVCEFLKDASQNFRVHIIPVRHHHNAVREDQMGVCEGTAGFGSSKINQIQN